METSKLEAINSWPQPTSLKQLRGFLGLTGYYRRFIRNYASMASPLTDLSKKNSFHWSELASQAFLLLKKAMTSAPVLAIPNFKEPFILETDTPGSGIGAILSQAHHPVAYFSKKLSPRMQKQSTYAREFNAITEALAKFRHYLLGHKFIIKTDQTSLKELLEQTLQTPEQQQWLPKFLGYDFTIQYKPGKDNVPADALSRSLFMAWSKPTNNWLIKVAEETKKDNILHELLNQHAQGVKIYHNYEIKDGLVFRKGKLMILEDSFLRHQILQEFHDTKIGGHAGRTKTVARICTQFYWPKMQEDIKTYIKKL
ncbi:hypothetical protein V8G54_036468 [Vigna mungo]|uniref:Reverse transcriptase/retrotransposon-derived protein RNase H-like domain-containing protein n=1 Tax=Vigna mungo TaxID=3915 RepID=A0AAQ3MGU5_VIGMU